MKPGRIMKILDMFVFTISIIMMLTIQSYALGTNTHKEINVYIVDKNSNFRGYSLDQYLKNLGIIDGITTKFDSKGVLDWISDGGENEDNGFRSPYHFHDPITNEGLGINYSALYWATMPVGAQGLFLSSSWNDVRDYYLKALSSADKTTREKYFSMTFQGVGQLMHLVQDMSVPAHVRGDIHPPPFWNDDYEDWIRKFFRIASQSGAYAPYRTYTPYNASFLIPQLFDTDRYTGGNPDITTSSSSIGLAEYTNANFFSGGTINSSEFPYPKTDNSKKVKIPYAGPLATYDREYFLKDCGEPYCQMNASKSYNGYLLSAVDMHDYWRLMNPKYSRYIEVIPTLDENVHYDYAQLLIPRAIGYSSQVLSYFFRGKINLIVNPIYPEGYILVNESEEDMEGTFSFYYDDTSNQRRRLWDGFFRIGANDKSGNIVLPIPTDAKELDKYIVVFKGRLGNETNAVVGKYTSGGYWEPWNGPNVDSKNPWEIYNWPASGQGAMWEITFNPLPPFEESKVLHFKVTGASPYGSYCLLATNGGVGSIVPLEKPIPIDGQKKLFFNIRTLKSGSGFGQGNLFVVDSKGIRKQWFFYDSRDYQGASSSNHPVWIGDNDGTVGLDLSPLSGSIIYLQFEIGVEPGVTIEFWSDFIDIREAND